MSNAFDHITGACDHLCRSVMGESVLYFNDGTNVEVLGLLTQEQLEIDSLGHPVVASPTCIVDLRRDDLPREPQLGDLLQVRGVKYKVTLIKPDIHGGMKLNLMRIDYAR